MFAIAISSTLLAQHPCPNGTCNPVIVEAPRHEPPYLGPPPPVIVPPPNVIELPVGPGDDVCQQIENDAPHEADKFCKKNFSRQQRAQALVERLFREAATSSDRGADSSFGLLHRFLQTSEAHRSVPGRGSSASAIVGIIGAALENLRAHNSTSVDWVYISRQIGEYCFITEVALTGREINPWPTHSSTDLCLAGSAVLAMEARGVPFNPDQYRTWLDAFSVGGGVEVNLGEVFSRALESLGFRDGLRNGSALNALGDFVDKTLKACERYLDEADRNHCPVP